jgi:segregation and condensation protein B
MAQVNPELKNIIEAAILVAGQPLTVDRMLALFPEESRPTRDEIKDALRQLDAECAGRGIELKQIDNGYRFQSREKYGEWLARLYEERPARYSRALLETLAIVAYRQPVTRGEIEEIRGVAVSSEIIKTLMTREWVRQVGQRDVPGRPALYGTTRGFLEHFNLKSLAELPPLAELRDIEQIAAELNLSLPVSEGAPGSAGADPAQADEPDVDDDSDETGEDDVAGEHRAAAERTEAQAVQADPGSAPAKL